MLKNKLSQIFMIQFLGLCMMALMNFPLFGESSVAQTNLYTEERPWGSFTILEEQENYKVKRIVVKPGQRLSLQSHNHRTEHWVIVQGIGLVTLGDQVKQVFPNDYVYVAVQQLHRIQNIGDQTLIFIETQCGDYLGEDDIIRYSDDYGR